MGEFRQIDAVFGLIGHNAHVPSWDGTAYMISPIGYGERHLYLPGTNVRAGESPLVAVTRMLKAALGVEAEPDPDYSNPFVRPTRPDGPLAAGFVMRLQPHSYPPRAVNFGYSVVLGAPQGAAGMHPELLEWVQAFSHWTLDSRK